jgi:hypothetical protein
MTETLFSYREMTDLARTSFRAGFRAALGRPDVYALADIDLDLQLRSETSHIVKICDELADRMGWSFAVGYAFGLQIKKEER